MQVQGDFLSSLSRELRYVTAEPFVLEIKAFLGDARDARHVFTQKNLDHAVLYVLNTL